MDGAVISIFDAILGSKAAKAVAKALSRTWCCKKAKKRSEVKMKRCIRDEDVTEEVAMWPRDSGGSPKTRARAHEFKQWRHTLPDGAARLPATLHTEYLIVALHLVTTLTRCVWCLFDIFWAAQYE